MAKKNLVIVESPAKAKTIGKYLGNSFQVKASMGHVRDLPKSKLGVDLEHGFEPDYQPIKGKEAVINELRDAAKHSERVYLATDPDREGEAISWHLKELLDLPEEKALRVTFQEITRKVVTESIEAPRHIDQNLVDAQQARRILDRIVGYRLSPLLWRKIRQGLSAGRVQSVAARLVVEREEEIRAFQPKEYWQLQALLDRIAPNAGSFTAQFHGTEKKKMELGSEAETQAVMNAVKNSPFSVKSIVKKEKERTPAPPFITSTLQQEASRKLGMPPRLTMSVAQQLYEGVDITGEGTVGLITYMRTDSLRLSEEALTSAKEFIVKQYGERYYPGKPRRFKTKSNAQDAHEAIRPSNVFLVPEEIKKDLTKEQFKLYKLIWGRFVASQMAAAVYDNISIDVISGGYVFRANNATLKFAGFIAVYEESRDDDQEERQSPLPDLREGESLSLAELKHEQKFTQPPARYTEATLIRALEERGIGRPSTYAPIVSTILDREYVVKEGKSLRPTPLGEVVNGLMKDKFSQIVDPDFTARLEEKLDDVESGSEAWKSLLADFYKDFSSALEQAERDLNGERIKVPDEVSNEICDVCGRRMVFKSGRFGRFLACPGFPECTFTKPIVVEMPGKCPRCGGRILKKTSKRGFAYYACEKGADCGFMTWDVPVEETCPSCGKTMFKLSGRGSKRPFCINEACDRFVPEEKRGYKKKTASGEPSGQAEEASRKEDGKKAASSKKAGTKKTAAKSSSASKSGAKKTASTSASGKKTAAKRSSSKTSALEKGTQTPKAE